jgi:glycosyltransferase involved in cell wall biosynthesis
LRELWGLKDLGLGRIFQVWRKEKSRFHKIGINAIVQRTMPEGARAIFRFLLRTHLALNLIITKFTGSLTDRQQTELINEGRSLLLQGKLLEARQIFQVCLEKAPVNEDAALWLTRVFLIQGEYLPAQKVLFRALAWHTKSQKLHHQLASLLLATGSFWEAEPEYRKLETSQYATQANLAIADLYFGNAKYDDALGLYKRVLEKDPSNISATVGVDAINHREINAFAKSYENGKAILIIDYLLPVNGRSAGSSRLFEIIKIIREAGYHVTLIALNGEYQMRAQLQLEEMGVETFATDPERLIAWNYKAKASQIPFADLFKKNQYTLGILCRYQIASNYMPVLRHYAPDLPIAVDTVDVHFSREEKKKVLYSLDPSDAKEIKEEELSVYSKADFLITVSKADSDILSRHFPSKPIIIIPLIYSPEPQRYSFNDRKDLLFVGNFVHPPNSDALIQYCSRILPLLRKRLPGIKTYVVGANSLPLLEDFANEDVIITGFVPDLNFFLNRCRVNVAPLRYGAGTNGKILESLATGLPVVTTPVGIEGIADERGMIVATSPEEFVDAIAAVYSDEQLWNSLSSSGRALIEDRFAPDVVKKDIIEFLNAGRGSVHGTRMMN